MEINFAGNFPKMRSRRFQMRRLSTELINAEGKLSELERVVKKVSETISSIIDSRSRTSIAKSPGYR